MKEGLTGRVATEAGLQEFESNIKERFVGMGEGRHFLRWSRTLLYIVSFNSRHTVRQVLSSHFTDGEI